MVERAEMVKGYEFEKDRFVIFPPDELKALQESPSHTIDIVAFIPDKAVDPIFYDKAYFLAPDKRGGKPYNLLMEAMRESGRCALAKWAWKGKQYVVQVRPAEDGLVLQQLLYADEVRSLKELDIEKVDGLATPSCKLAMQLIDQISRGHLRPDDVRGRGEEAHPRRDRREDRRQADRRPTEPVEPQPGGQVIDLMEALRASLGTARRPPRARPRPRPRPSRRRPRRPRNARASSARAKVAKRAAAAPARARREEVTRAGARQPLHAAQHPGDAGPLARRHRRPDRRRLRRAAPRPAQRVPLHLPGRGAAAHRRRAAGGADPAAQDPAGAAAAEGDAAGRAAARPACASRAVGNDVDGARGRLAMAGRVRPAADGLRVRAGKRQRHVPAAPAPRRQRCSRRRRPRPSMPRSASARRSRRPTRRPPKRRTASVLALDPDHADAYLNLGALLCEAGRCEEAVALYDEALRRKPGEALLHFNRAVALEDQGRPRRRSRAYNAQPAARARPRRRALQRRAAARAARRREERGPPLQRLRRLERRR